MPYHVARVHRSHSDAGFYPNSKTSLPSTVFESTLTWVRARPCAAHTKFKKIAGEATTLKGSCNTRQAAAHAALLPYNVQQRLHRSNLLRRALLTRAQTGSPGSTRKAQRVGLRRAGSVLLSRFQEAYKRRDERSTQHESARNPVVETQNKIHGWVSTTKK